MLDFSFPNARTASGRCVDQTEPDAARNVVIHVVAQEFRLDTKALTAATRGNPDAAFARQVAMYLLHVGFALNFVAVGRAFGRDRTTVAHACRRIEDRRENNLFDRRMTRLEAACRSAMNGGGR